MNEEREDLLKQITEAKGYLDVLLKREDIAFKMKSQLERSREELEVLWADYERIFSNQPPDTKKRNLSEPEVQLALKYVRELNESTKKLKASIARANTLSKGKQEIDSPEYTPVFGPNFEQVLNDSLASANTAWEQSKKARAANQPSALIISSAPKKKHPSGEIKGFSNILPVIDAVENQIMEVLKKSGYTKMTKTEETRRFSKSDTDYFDVYKDGSMKSNGVGLDGSLKEISDDMVKKFIDMVCVFQEVANKYGKDLAFPAGPMDMTILKENIRPQDAAKVSIINQFTRDTVIRALSDPKFDAIRDRFTYDGKPLTTVNEAADVASIKIPNSAQAKPNSATEKTKRASMENTEALGLTGAIPAGRKKFAYTSNRDELRIKAITNNQLNRNKLGK